MSKLYLFFSETFHFRNLSYGYASFSSIPLLLMVIAIGALFRYTVTTKKGFYAGLSGVFTVWLIGQIAYSYVGVNDLIDYAAFTYPIFNTNWLLSSFFVTALVTHLVFRILRKRPLV